MKKIILVLLCTFLSVGISAQNFVGAWESYHNAENGTQLKSVVLFADGYQVITTYEALTGKFIATNGGTWTVTGDMMTEKVEFDSKNPERVGSEVRFEVFINDSIMGIVGSENKFKRIDSGAPGKLQGAWLMSGRIKDGETQVRDTSRPRKTMKILSGTRFQWIAYNTETKEFFSRDDSRVGANLQFDFSLVDANWHHTGLSSKGDPIHEIWSKRE